jgi:hypothetical protein
MMQMNNRLVAYAWLVTALLFVLLMMLVFKHTECEQLRKTNVELAMRVIEWEKVAKHVLLQAIPEEGHTIKE